jgi:predicted AlkP superfamily phosphohydrolase/phosphomutase
VSSCSRVFAIWMESAELEWINALAAAGKLPIFEQLRQQGTISYLEGPTHTASEVAHPMLISGCLPSTSGGWSVQPFDPKTYQLSPTEPFGYEQHPPFYDLDPSIRTLTFDLSETPVFDHLPATQIAGWGAHAPLGPRSSKPSGLVDEIVTRFGDHPTGQGRDQADAHSQESLEKLFRDVMSGLKMREAATIALMKEQPWDLFLTDFSEFHSAGHFLMPPANEHDSLAQWCRERLEAVDATLGRMLDSLPDEVRVVVFSIHGMRSNYEDSANLLL